ncbi:MAG TPA: hypothetical protein VJ826_00120 [Candidatus Polarisedimenticolaceae bacterium]|nr:hypothetical protein [Candidatus Polarisedimenticolaceae bacterium]
MVLRLSIVVGVLAATAALAEPTAESKVVGRAAPRSAEYKISEAGVHYAVRTPKGAKWVMVVDGVEGPEFDQFLDRRGHPANVENLHVVFSADGARHAYLAQVGQDYNLIVDGKVMAKGPLGPSNLGYHDMTMSPLGKHVYFIDLNPENGRAKATLVMDGKPGPFAGHQNLFPIFNATEANWAYTAVKLGGRQTDLLTIVDGKEAAYLGYEPVYTGDGNLVKAPAGVTLGGKISAAPKGTRWAGVMAGAKPTDTKVLYIDGKAVPECAWPESVTWSPDGKRYMAVCPNREARTKFILLDGKKGPEFMGFAPNLTKFSADGSRAIYVGVDKMGKHTVFADGVAGAPMTTLMGQTDQVVLAPKGNRYAYLAGEGQVVTLVLDGKATPFQGTVPMPGSLGFSADGTRFAYVTAKAALPPRRTLVVDGKEQGGVNLMDIPKPREYDKWWVQRYGPQFTFYQFSPDGKHVATFGSSDAGLKNTVFVDEKPLTVAGQANNGQFLSWSPDSKHLFWVSGEGNPGQAVYRVYVNGKASQARYTGEQPVYAGTWEIGADNVLSMLVFDGLDTKRWRVTPDPAVTIDAALAAVK